MAKPRKSTRGNPVSNSAIDRRLSWVSEWETESLDLEVRIQELRLEADRLNGLCDSGISTSRASQLSEQSRGLRTLADVGQSTLDEWHTEIKSARA